MNAIHEKLMVASARDAGQSALLERGASRWVGERCERRLGDPEPTQNRPGGFEHWGGGVRALGRGWGRGRRRSRGRLGVRGWSRRRGRLDDFFGCCRGWLRWFGHDRLVRRGSAAGGDPCGDDHERDEQGDRRDHQPPVGQTSGPEAGVSEIFPRRRCERIDRGGDLLGAGRRADLLAHCRLLARCRFLARCRLLTASLEAILGGTLEQLIEQLRRGEIPPRRDQVVDRDQLESLASAALLHVLRPLDTHGLLIDGLLVFPDLLPAVADLGVGDAVRLQLAFDAIANGHPPIAQLAPMVAQECEANARVVGFVGAVLDARVPARERPFDAEAVVEALDHLDRCCRVRRTSQGSARGEAPAEFFDLPFDPPALVDELGHRGRIVE